VAKSFLQAQNMESNIKNAFLRENYVIRSLGSARDLGMVIAKNAIDKDNNFMKTIISGAKGDYFNICQITGLLGQQDIEGSRVNKLLSNGTRTLYHYPHNIENQDMMYESRGFIRNSFIHGLNPREYWFHSMSGRIGIISTSLKTSTSGYVQRRMVKIAEDLQIKYDNTVRGVNESIIQFSYGDNCLDSKTSVVLKDQVHVCNVERLVNKLNYQHEQKCQI
jgi:DNA-directed RNA polymerase II subunit RPB1